jgi:hypothetical protein
VARRGWFRRARRAVARKLYDFIYAPEPPPPTIPTTPPPTESSRIAVGFGYDPRSRNIYSGFPFEMGNMEAGWWIQLANRQPPHVRDTMLGDRYAMHLYHRAFFGFRGDENGENKLTRPEMEDLRVRAAFYDYMLDTYGIDFYASGFPWEDYRAQYGPRTDRVSA